nr:MAG: hypothetical protein [Bacteriophage sp.]
MNIDVDGLLDGTVTVFNRICAKDSGEGADRYRPLVLHPALWAETLTRSTDADGTVHLERTVKVQVPDGTATFKPYGEWVSEAVKGATAGVYTLSLHDYLMEGSVAARGDMTRQEVIAAVEGEPHCEVTAFRDLRGDGAVSAPEAGCLKYASVVYAEGA